MSSSTLPPVIPARSRLRAVAPPPLESTPSYILPVAEPLDQRPAKTLSLSSSGSSDRGSPRDILNPPEQDTVVFGKNRKRAAGATLSKDPLRIRDGAEARSSSSGVYTRKSEMSNTSDRIIDKLSPYVSRSSRTSSIPFPFSCLYTLEFRSLSYITSTYAEQLFLRSSRSLTFRFSLIIRFLRFTYNSCICQQSIIYIFREDDGWIQANIPSYQFHLFIIFQYLDSYADHTSFSQR